jgi:starch-binding outer membrane protein, SusD/RagB family
MRTALLRTLAVLGLGIGATGCDLTGPKLSSDPNNPTAATTRALFVAAQVDMFVESESDLARSVCTWLNQCSGRLSQYFGVDNYSALGDGDFWYEDWSRAYGTGGLIDLRRIEATSIAAGDSAFAGVALVLEAWQMGTLTTVWGDIPYSEAVNPGISAPHLDTQQNVYITLQDKLDTAITYLTATGPTNVGPLDADLVYNGDLAIWARLAATLKARFYMHTTEVDPAAYDQVLAQAGQLLQPGEDYTNFHTTDLPSSNIWFQFFSTAAADYMAAGATLVDTLQNAGDPRLAEYFSPSPADGVTFVGGAPGGNDTLTVGTISSLSATRLAPDFRQPLVTWAEGQLLVAEAQFGKGQTANALTTLETVRADAGLAPLAPAPTGNAILHAIMVEKYIRMFQTIEAWNDYRRTCEPHLTPANGLTIPTRIPYPLSERAANPSIPDAGPARNFYDPNPCP